MLLTWFLGGYAVGVTFWFVREVRKNIKLKKEYDKRCKELMDALGEVGRQKLQNKNLELYLKYTQGVLFWGRKNLSVKEISSTEMAVIGTTSKSPEEMVVKIFNFNPKDPEDRDFAIREAEELIETINKF